MTFAPAEHPTTEQLSAFDQGCLGPDEWESVENHLAHCQTCCAELETVPDDDLAGLVRSAGRSVTEAFAPAAGPDSRGMPPAGDGGAVRGLPPELADHPRYRVVGVLGAGGMGTVFKVEHRLMRRLVALKVIDPRWLERPDAVERFRREVQAAARLSHPNIVTAFDAEQAGRSHFLVMEYVEGESLDRWLVRQRAATVAQASDWVRQAALGLQHAHERGMVHRDIKPANLMLTHEGRVKILDFGLARLLGENGDRTRDSRGPVPVFAHDPADQLTPQTAVVGTPDYVAPEQARSPHEADIRADIYALGCTLYHLLTGRPPFAQGTVLQKLMAHQEQTPPPLPALRGDVPPPLVRVVERMLAKDPAERYQTPAQVAAALEPFAAATSASTTVAPAPADPGPAPVAAPPRRRRGLLVALAALVAVAGVTAAVIIIKTKQGTIKIDTDDATLQARVDDGGKRVVIEPGAAVGKPDQDPSLIASSGFNNLRGLNHTAEAGKPFRLSASNRTGGQGEPGWAGPWPAEPSARFQRDVVFEGDGALYLTGTVNYFRRLAEPQTGRFSVEQMVRLPEGGDVKCYLWKKEGAAEQVTGPMWAASRGEFAVMHGGGDGQGEWLPTGFACKPGTWYKVELRIDVPRRTWVFLVDGREFKPGRPLGFRGPETGALAIIDYLTETPAGVYLDALRVRQLPEAGKARRASVPASAPPVNDLIRKGVAYATKGEFNKAIEAYTQAIAKDPKSADAYCCRGIAYGEKRDFEKAREDYTTAIRLNPPSASAYYNRGRLSGLEGRLDAAIDDYTHAIDIDHGFADAYVGRGLTCFQKRDYQRAISDATAAIQHQPRDAEAFLLRGQARVETGQASEAIEDLTRAIKLKPKSPDAYYYRALAYVGTHNLAKAVADWTEVIKLDPKNAPAYASRGLAQVDRGTDLNAAMADFDKSLQLNPQMGAAHFGRARVYEKWGDRQKAQEEAARARQLGYPPVP
jgi:tetratricopeptide (TPR) repeat protein